jgi:MOSC domain-containing protein YiiM
VAVQAVDPTTTTVVALFLHGPRASMPGDSEPTPMIPVQEVDAVDGVGLHGEPPRHVRQHPEGRESKRQVCLIDQGTLARHHERFGEFPLEFVKAQVVLAGDVYLPDLLGRELVFGEGDGAVVLELTIRRDPCEQMDLIAPGLRVAMKNGAQGALARVVRGGHIAIGQRVIVR